MPRECAASTSCRSRPRPALARDFLAAGHPTTVWNRTPGRSPELEDLGATRATTVAEAVQAAPLVIACLLDYASVNATLGPLNALPVMIGGPAAFVLYSGAPDASSVTIRLLRQ